MRLTAGLIYAAATASLLGSGALDATGPAWVLDGPGIWLGLASVLMMDLYLLLPWASDVRTLRRPISRSAALQVAIVVA